MSIVATAALPRTFGRRDADGGSKHHVPTSRGFDRPLCAGKVFVRLDGLDVETGSCHDFRVHTDDGSRKYGYSKPKVPSTGASKSLLKKGDQTYGT